MNDYGVPRWDRNGGPQGGNGVLGDEHGDQVRNIWRILKDENFAYIEGGLAVGRRWNIKVSRGRGTLTGQWRGGNKVQYKGWKKKYRQIHPVEH